MCGATKKAAAATTYRLAMAPSTRHILPRIFSFLRPKDGRLSAEVPWLRQTHRFSSGIVKPLLSPKPDYKYDSGARNSLLYMRFSISPYGVRSKTD